MLKISNKGIVYCEDPNGNYRECEQWDEYSTRCPTCPMGVCIIKYLTRKLRYEHAALECTDSV